MHAIYGDRPCFASFLLFNRFLLPRQPPAPSLQNYNQQAKAYHNSCVLEIREQLERFETSVAEIPPVVIEDVKRRQSDDLRKKLTKMQTEWGQKADQLEQQRVRNNGDENGAVLGVNDGSLKVKKDGVKWVTWYKIGHLLRIQLNPAVPDPRITVIRQQ